LFSSFAECAAHQVLVAGVVVDQEHARRAVLVALPAPFVLRSIHETLRVALRA
jgi:hypothetical protein